MKTLNPLYFISFAILALTSSCEKFLDLKPTNALLADHAVYDAKTSRALVNEAYTQLKSYQISNALVLGLLPGDNVFFGGSQSQNIELDNHAFTVTNSAIVAAYRANYRLINVTNWAISEIPKINDDNLIQEEKQKLIGEAHFIRAFAYFTLAKSWGGVQLQLEPTRDLTTLGQIRRSSKKETYGQVYEDLDKALSLLPPDDAHTRNLAQHAIVQALKAKVYLYDEQFERAEQEANAVIENPKYALTEDYQHFFQSPFLSKESVFEISATANNAGVSANPWLPSSGTPRGSYEYRPTNEVVELLEDPGIGGDRVSLLANRGNNTYGNLYHMTTPNLNPAYVIRLADLYLIRAESRLRKQNPDLQGAIDDLHAIRSRAKADLFPTGNADPQSLLQAIWDERRVEFAFEADRWYDLVRSEQAEKVLGVQKNFWYFPIPQADVLADPDLN